MYSDSWEIKYGELVCSSCGIPRELGAPDFGKTPLISGSYYPLTQFKKHESGTAKLNDSCICQLTKYSKKGEPEDKTDSE